ncbi:unnamed protein product [Amoebophrya sp. A120]|nr:unnamed protein product [Amoebophrya sp. A120]|eukprot:GSA120T00022398001.1
MACRFKVEECVKTERKIKMSAGPSPPSCTRHQVLVSMANPNSSGNYTSSTSSGPFSRSPARATIFTLVLLCDHVSPPRPCRAITMMLHNKKKVALATKMTTKIELFLAGTKKSEVQRKGTKAGINHMRSKKAGKATSGSSSEKMTQKEQVAGTSTAATKLYKVGRRGKRVGAATSKRTTSRKKNKNQSSSSMKLSPHAAASAMVAKRTSTDHCPEAFLTKIDYVSFDLDVPDASEWETSKVDDYCWKRDYLAKGYSITSNRRCREKCHEREGCDVWSFQRNVTADEENRCVIGGGWSPRWRKKQLDTAAIVPECNWQRTEHSTSDNLDAMGGVCHPWATCGFMFGENEAFQCNDGGDNQNFIFLPNHECNLGSTWEKCKARCCLKTSEAATGIPPIPDFYRIYDNIPRQKTQRIRVLFVGNSLTVGQSSKLELGKNRAGLPRYVQLLAESVNERLDVDEDTAGSTTIHMKAHNAFLAGFTDFRTKCAFAPETLDDAGNSRHNSLGCPQKGMGTSADWYDTELFLEKEYVQSRYDIISLQEQSDNAGFTTSAEHFYQSSVEFYQAQFPEALIVSHMPHGEREPDANSKKIYYKNCPGVETKSSAYFEKGADWPKEGTNFDFKNIQPLQNKYKRNSELKCRVYPSIGYGKYATQNHACWNYSLFRNSAHSLMHGAGAFVPAGLAVHIARKADRVTMNADDLETCDEDMDSRWWNKHEKVQESSEHFQAFHKNGYDNGETFDFNVGERRLQGLNHKGRKQTKYLNSLFQPLDEKILDQFRYNVLHKPSAEWVANNLAFSDDELFVDHIHLTDLGQYIVACTWVAVVLKKDLSFLCENNNISNSCWRPESVSEADAGKVYRIVNRVLSRVGEQSGATGQVQTYDPCSTWSNRERCGTVGYYHSEWATTVAVAKLEQQAQDHPFANRCTGDASRKSTQIAGSPSCQKGICEASTVTTLSSCFWGSGNEMGKDCGCYDKTGEFVPVYEERLVSPDGGGLVNYEDGPAYSVPTTCDQVENGNKALCESVKDFSDGSRLCSMLEDVCEAGLYNCVDATTETQCTKILQFSNYGGPKCNWDSGAGICVDPLEVDPSPGCAIGKTQEQCEQIVTVHYQRQCEWIAGSSNCEEKETLTVPECADQLDRNACETVPSDDGGSTSNNSGLLKCEWHGLNQNPNTPCQPLGSWAVVCAAKTVEECETVKGEDGEEQCTIVMSASFSGSPSCQAKNAPMKENLCLGKDESEEECKAVTDAEGKEICHMVEKAVEDTNNVNDNGAEPLKTCEPIALSSSSGGGGDSSAPASSKKCAEQVSKGACEALPQCVYDEEHETCETPLVVLPDERPESAEDAACCQGGGAGAANFVPIEEE